MKNNYIAYVILGLSGLTFYKSFIEKPEDAESKESGGGGFFETVKEIFIGSSNTDKKNSSEKPKTQEDIPVSKKSLNSTSEKISVKSNTSFSDFEKQLVIDDFNTAKAVSTSSSSKKSKKRTYERTATKNNDIIEIKEAGETVGGMDLKNRMTLNKKGAKQKKAEMEHGIGSVEWIIAGISK